MPEFSIDDAPKPDVIVFPGGSSGRLTNDSRFMAWATKAMQDAEVTLTICTGAFVAAKAGLLDGQVATTWYDAIFGRSAADRTARYMEYHWSPEAYLARSYSSLHPGLEGTDR